MFSFCGGQSLHNVRPCHLVGGIGFGGVFTLNDLSASGVFTICDSPTAGMANSSIWPLNNVLNQEVRKVVCVHHYALKKTRRNEQQDAVHCFRHVCILLQPSVSAVIGCSSFYAIAAHWILSMLDIQFSSGVFEVFTINDPVVGDCTTASPNFGGGELKPVAHLLTDLKSCSVNRNHIRIRL